MELQFMKSYIEAQYMNFPDMYLDAANCFKHFQMQCSDEFWNVHMWIFNVRFCSSKLHG